MQSGSGTALAQTSSWRENAIGQAGLNAVEEWSRRVQPQDAAVHLNDVGLHDVGDREER